MKKLFKKYGGAILFYGVIVIMIVLVNARFAYLNDLTEKPVTYAYND